jgi:hypothetical protein
LGIKVDVKNPLVELFKSNAFLVSIRNSYYKLVLLMNVQTNYVYSNAKHNNFVIDSKKDFSVY